jgi:hypothetical protein
VFELEPQAASAPANERPATTQPTVCRRRTRKPPHMRRMEPGN